MATIGVQILDRITSLVGAVLPVGADCAARVEISENVTVSGFARVSPGDEVQEFADAWVRVCLRQVEIAVVVVESNAVDRSIETACARWLGAIVNALETDESLAALASAGGLTVAAAEPFDPSEDQISGLSIALSVCYSHSAADAETTGGI